MNELKRMKIIPLRGQSRLVSIDEFEQRAIVLPLDKKIAYAKYLRTVLEDTPMIDERLLDLIEQKYPRRFEPIKRLLKELGLTEALNIRGIYSNHILPVMMDDAQWSSKSDAVLIAYVMCIFKDIYAVQPDRFESEFEKLKTQLIVKIHTGKFVRMNSAEHKVIHLPSSYGYGYSLENVKSLRDQLTFISNDYLNLYRQEVFTRENERKQFIHFLVNLGISEFFLVEPKDQRK